MLKKTIALALIGAGALFFGNCISGGPVGSLYTNVVYDATVINKDTSQEQGIGSKSGEACASSVLNLVATGDAGIKAAASNGDISKVKAMDIRTSSVLGSLYVKHCTIVHGN